MPNSFANPAAGLTHRAVFISDLHLGARASQPLAVLDFLRGCRAETLYLVGDILDIWHVGKVHWTEAHDAVLAELARHVRNGSRVVYLVGNHDREVRNDRRFDVAGVEFRQEIMHRAADGRTYLVLHGDQGDRRMLRWHFMTRAGSRIDSGLRSLDRRLRDRFGAVYFERNPINRGLAAFHDLLAMGEGYENRLTEMARAAGAQGVICGHSHRPGLRDHNGIVFANSGDWLDSMTALTESHDGAFELVQWQPAYARAARQVPVQDFQPVSVGHNGLN